MAIYTDSKSGIGELTPAGAIESTWRRTEPLITSSLMTTRHLFGIPLVSGIKDPLTRRAQVMTPEIIDDYIRRAVGTIELETSLTLFPTQIEEKMPYDRQEYQSFGYMRLLKRPVTSIEYMAIAPSNNQDVFVVPNEWIDTGQLYHGQLNIIPLTIALSGSSGSVVSSAGGPALLAILGQHQWLASYWRVRYTAGFPDGNLPTVVNDLIGVTAAIDILSMLAATNGRNTSGSLSIDAMSQSVSTPGPEVYTRRIEDLEKKRLMITNKLKSLFGQKLFSGNV